MPSVSRFAAVKARRRRARWKAASARPPEVLPAGARREAAEPCLDITELGHAALIGGPLGVGEVEVQGDGVEGGEETPGEIADRELVGRRPDEVQETTDGRLCARRSRREAEARRGGRHLERLVAHPAAEVVYLVDHEEIEAVPETLHAPVRALEGRNRHRSDLIGDVAEAAEGDGVGAPYLHEPLLQQHARGNQAE